MANIRNSKQITFWSLGIDASNLFDIWYHFSLLKNEFQKPKKLKESKR
jgi:hypothetical protein